MNIQKLKKYILVRLNEQLKRQRLYILSAPQRPKVIPFDAQPKSAPKKQEVSYTHRCTVCGRTDVSHPDLEFRYCSRCKGYYCYCEDHISNHSHIQ